MLNFRTFDDQPVCSNNSITGRAGSEVVPVRLLCLLMMLIWGQMQSEHPKIGGRK